MSSDGRGAVRAVSALSLSLSLLRLLLWHACCCGEDEDGFQPTQLSLPVSEEREQASIQHAEPWTIPIPIPLFFSSVFFYGPLVPGRKRF